MSEQNFGLDWQGDVTQRDVIQAIKAGVNELNRQVKVNSKAKLSKGHGKDKGKLSAGIVYKGAKLDGNQVIGAVGGKRWYSAMVFKGTKAHPIKAKPGGILAFHLAAGAQITTHRLLYRSAKSGKLIKTAAKSEFTYAKSVQHPGIRTPVPAVQDAYNELAGRAVEIVGAVVRAKTMPEAEGSEG